MFLVGSEYTRSEIWSNYHPDEPYPGGGPWTTGYASTPNNLIIFANIGVPGRTGHDFPNAYDADTQTMKWYGKPKAHSAQPTLHSLLTGERKAQVFARWNSSRPKFFYLGEPDVLSYEDNVMLGDGTQTIRFNFNFSDVRYEAQDPGPEGNQSQPEGKMTSVLVNKYERDPALRAACIEHFGTRCLICGFDFEQTYGTLGKDFCHVHHIVPLSEMNEETKTNPATDLIPVCPNCHSMLHRKRPALHPEELKNLLAKHPSKDI